MLFDEPKVLVLDLETTVQKTNDKIDNSPFHPDNKIVSAHWKRLEDTGVKSLIFHHKEQLNPDPPEALQRALDDADIMVAHNAKFDAMWLLEAGFRLPKRIYCTMIGEYIFARGQRTELSLYATAERRDVTRKKSELVDDLFKQGIGFEAMPLNTVLEYAEADVQSCAEIYQKQQDEIDFRSPTLRPVFDLMNEMTQFLIEIERNGIAIDMTALLDVEKQFVAERDQIVKRLNDIVVSVMGDRPINLNSGTDMSMVIYSREITNKHLHREVFNIGTGPTGKPLPQPHMTTNKFAQAVRQVSRIIQKQIAVHCHTCDGTGKIRKVKKDGTLFKKDNYCPECNGKGSLYRDTGKTAGLRLSPESPRDASVNGFKTDKETVKRLIGQAHKKNNLEAVEFLQSMSRLNALETYLSSFVDGIKAWTRPDGILHANFNQTVTATGRLSSSNPNFQNQPKGGKFPVRKAVVSRFKGGFIVEADFSGLEFRVAGELSRDQQIIDDILSGKDVHKQTASIINQKPVEDITKTERQGAKAYTFAPLYGGMGANEAPHVQKYFQEFFVIYSGLSKWHKTLMDGVLLDGIVRIPSGREFFWPNAKRTKSGRITNATQVVNYPVQSFATADIVPLACVRALQKFRELGLRSKLVLTVHDSIVVDCHPDELESVRDALVWAMMGVSTELESRFKYTPILPLNIEIEYGTNWMEQSPIVLDLAA
jgi:DNA polymerase I-like protein with 3'-5' exonuclease and polymerase domains